MNTMYSHELHCSYNDRNRKRCMKCLTPVAGNKRKDHDCIRSLSLRNVDLASSFLKQQKKAENDMKIADGRFHTALRCVVGLHSQIEELGARTRILEVVCSDMLGNKRTRFQKIGKGIN